MNLCKHENAKLIIDTPIWAVTCNKMEAPKEVRSDLYPISGVPVRFPCKPYPTQLQMMSKVN